MKTSSIIISGVISILSITVVGMGTKMIMDNKTIAPVSVSTGEASAPVHIERPKIVKVTSQYTTKSVPTQSCQIVNQTQMVNNENKNGTTGGVIGGTTGAVAGGVIGKQIGGNTAGTLIGGGVGLLIGAVAGNKIQKATQPDQVAQNSQVRKCTPTTKTVKKITGYEVAYTYQGQDGSVVMKNKPTGKYLPLSAIN